MLWLGSDELERKEVKIKCMYKNTEEYVGFDSYVSKLDEYVKQYQVDLREGNVNFDQKK